MNIKLAEVIERMLELSEEKTMCCYYTHKNISMGIKINPEDTEQNGTSVIMKDYYTSVNEVCIDLNDITSFEYQTEEEAGNQKECGIMVENLRIYFNDGSELIIMEEI